jgi:uncharacterized protein
MIARVVRMSLAKKMKQLKSIIAECESAVIAFSGGVDSSLVCAVAHGVLVERVIAVTAVSHTYPPGEIDVSKEVANRIGIKHMLIETDELEDPRFIANPIDRCYLCKSELLGKLKDVRKKFGFKNILDGTNHDDLSDFRPGFRALEEFGVISPLALAGIGKKEVRQLAARYYLPNFDKPANPCLASRIPFGRRITRESLERIAKAEKFVQSLGFRVVRVRDHGDLASIEVEKVELGRAFRLKNEMEKTLKRLGYSFVTVDPKGYRSGSLNPKVDISTRS